MKRFNLLLLLIVMMLSACCHTPIEPANPVETAIVDSQFPQRITSYEQLKSVLFSGYTVRIRNFYSDCIEKDQASGEDRPGADAIGGMELDTFEYFGDSVFENRPPYLATSKSQLIYVNGTFYQDYVKLRFFPDGTVEIMAKFYNIETHETIDLHDITCRINSGDDDDGGVSLYIGQKTLIR